MKAVIMAGGKGTRLSEAKGKLNKHCLPVYNKPMIVHVVETLVAGGAKQILVLLNWLYPQTILELLQDGKKFGEDVDIYYRYVDETDGPGRQLYLAENWVGRGNFVLMLGDSLYIRRKGAPPVLDFTRSIAPHIWTMPLAGLDDPTKYGQVTTHGDKVLELRDKPAFKFSDVIQTATWLLPPDVFDRARRLGESIAGEVHIGRIIEEYVAEGRVTHTRLPPLSYIDLGTPESLLRGANLLAEAEK